MDMLLTKVVEMKWNGRNKRHFTEKGHTFTKMGESFLVKVEELSKGSHIIIELKCDFCKREYERKYKSYLYYKDAHPLNNHIDCCNKCVYKKNELQYIEKYGVSYLTKLESFKEEHLYVGIEKAKVKFEKRDFILIDTVYTHSNDKLEFVCKSHVKKGSQHLSWTQFNRGFGCKYCSYDRLSDARQGEDNPNWNSDISGKIRDYARREEGYFTWRKNVLTRDDYKCVICETEDELVVHHKDGYHWCKERRIDITNGETLCGSCHRDFHSIYGVKRNTEEQFIEWMKV